MPIVIERPVGSTVRFLNDEELNAFQQEEAAKQWEAVCHYRTHGEIKTFIEAHPVKTKEDISSKDWEIAVNKLLHCTHIVSSGEPLIVTCYEDCLRNWQAWAEAYRANREARIAQIESEDDPKNKTKNPEWKAYIDNCHARKTAIAQATAKWRTLVAARKELDAIMEERVKIAKAVKTDLEKSYAPPPPKDQGEGFVYPEYIVDPNTNFPDLNLKVWKTLTEAGWTFSVVTDR